MTKKHQLFIEAAWIIYNIVIYHFCVEQQVPECMGIIDLVIHIEQNLKNFNIGKTNIFSTLEIDYLN